MKQAFSLLEIIFVLVIIALISSFALYNNGSFLKHSNMAKIKSDVALIRSAIASKVHQRVMKSNNEFPQVLDNAAINKEDELLFLGVHGDTLLDYPMISTSSYEKKVGFWSKSTSTHYLVWINKQEALEFVYDKNKGTFECDFNNELCKEIN